MEFGFGRMGTAGVVGGTLVSGAEDVEPPGRTSPAPLALVVAAAGLDWRCGVVLALVDAVGVLGALPALVVIPGPVVGKVLEVAGEAGVVMVVVVAAVVVVIVVVVVVHTAKVRSSRG